MIYITWQCPKCKRWQIQGLWKGRRPEEVTLKCKYSQCRAKRKLKVKDKHIGTIQNVGIAYIGNSPTEARERKWNQEKR